jgi:pimeloyl-ACP methyl ester carboxylesterase
MIFVSPDYRAKTSWMGPSAEADLLQIIGEVKKQYVVGRVFLCGGSMGGTSALIFASRHPELLAGVVAMNGTANMVEYDQFQDAIAESYGGTKAEVPEVYKERSAELFPDRFTMPIAFTTGGADTTVPPDSVLRLAEKLKASGRDVLLIHRQEGPHSTNYDDAMACFNYVFKRP